MRSASFLVALCVAGSAHAATPTPADGVGLAQLKVSGPSLTGTCGNAAIEVVGMERNATTGRRQLGQDAAITITSGNRSLRIGPGAEGEAGIYLQDRNKLECLDTPTGPKLLLTMYCGGRACAPVDYRVFDTQTAAVTSQPDAADECDAACAKKALGTAVPRE